MGILATKSNEEIIKKARQAFFSYGIMGAFQGDLNPLSSQILSMPVLYLVVSTALCSMHAYTHWRHVVSVVAHTPPHAECGITCLCHFNRSFHEFTGKSETSVLFIVHNMCVSPVCHLFLDM